MKILIIDEEFPYPLNTGKRIRSFNLARALGRQNQVVYLAYGESGSEGFNFLRENSITPIAIPPPDRRQTGPKFYWRLWRSLFAQYPYIVTSHYTRRFENKLRELSVRGRYDCIICEWTPYTIFLKGLDNVPSIIVAHNIESQIWQGYRSKERNPLKKLYISLQANRVDNFERLCFSWANGATAVSAEEAATIKGFGVKYPVEVVENGVDLDYFKPVNGPLDRDMLVFTASMDWRPNQDAVFYFVESILPHIREKRPGVKTFFVGRNPGKKMLDLGKIEGITVTGTVNDVRPYVARAGAYIVPLRIGGGSRLKILEAMAMKKAIISTSLGAEGLRVSDGVDILIADDPRHFAARVLECLDNARLRDTIACNGRKTVEEYYRWDTLGQKYDSYIRTVIGRAGKDEYILAADEQ